LVLNFARRSLAIVVLVSAYEAYKKMRIFKRCCAAVVSTILFVYSQMAPAQWQWVNPFPTGNPLSALTWDGSRYVAFDGAGAVLTSPDAITWTNNPSGLGVFVTALAWGNGTYVAAAVGFNGAQILTSPDAVTWTPHDVGIQVSRFSQVLWNPDLQQFILIADSGNILASANGSDWDPQGSGTVKDLIDVVWSNGQYVVVGASGTILTSGDGVDWKDHSIVTDEPLLSIAANGNLFAIVRGSGSSFDHSTIMTNDNPSKPANWHLAFGVVDPTAHSQLTRIVWDGGAFVAVGGIIATSIDGVVWTYVASQAVDTLLTVAFSSDTIVAADDVGTILVSTLDGLAWAPTSSDIVTESLNSVVWNGTVFGAVGDLGSFLSSSNGTDWDVNNFALPISPQALAWGNGTYVAVADGGIANSIDNGLSWNKSTEPELAGVTFRGVTWGDNQFVAVGAITVPTPPHLALFQGVIYTSPDGMHWTYQASNAVLGDSVQSVVWAGDKFVAVGAASEHEIIGNFVFIKFLPPPIFLSPDGVAWTRISPLPPSVTGEGAVLRSVAWNGHRFVAVGTPGPGDPRAVVTSPNGVNWQYVSPLPAVNEAGDLDSVVWTGNKFVAVGSQTSELTSADGVVWTTEPTGAQSLLSVASDGIQCVAVGDLGTIMRETSLCNADPLFKNGFD
jgi:hypothetical protein